VSEKPSALGTVVLWVLVMLVVVAVLTHGTATGMRLIRDNMPMHGVP
jgi:hypothetical protein